MLKVGLTGGIGVGKTTVSNYFQKLGIPIIDTDVIAHDLAAPGSATLNEIVSTFGEEVLTEHRELNRKHLGRIVFSNPSERRKLELILHPKIKEIALKQTQDLNAPYCILVVPLLVETDFVELVDKVLVVDAPDSQRISWIKKRSGFSESDVTRIIAAQTSRKERLKAADYVIVNKGSIIDLENKVLAVHETILAALENSE